MERKAIHATLDLRNSIFPFLNREWFDLRKILKTGHLKEMSYVGNLQVEIFVKSRVHSTKLSRKSKGTDV